MKISVIKNLKEGNKSVKNMEVTDILEQVMDERSSKYIIDYRTLFIPFGSRNMSP